MSSAGKKYITNQEAVPLIVSDIFYDHEDKRFALGVFNSNDVLSYEPNSIPQAYLRLRSNVYVDQKKFLANDIRRPDGTELDEDDERSTHFVMLENLIGKVGVFACMRLIEKVADEDRVLPIEEFFPDAFAIRAPKKSVEVSRFIARHDETKCCKIAKRVLMTAGLAYTLNNDLGPIFGVVEPGFERDLKIMRVPTRRVAEPRLVSEYNSENLGIEVDKFGFEDRLGKVAVRNMNIDAGSFGYWGNIG